MTVGGGKFDRAPDVEFLGAHLVVGHETHRDRQAGHRMFVQADRVPRRIAVGQHVADVRLVDHLGAAVMLRGRQADVHVDAERLGDLDAQELAEGAAGDAPGDLAEDEPEGHHVIALRGAGRPPRFGGGDVAAHAVPVQGLLRGQPGAGPDHPGAMSHHHCDGDVFLAGLAELRPVRRHRRIQVDLGAVGQQMHAGAGEGLGAGEDAGQRVLGPRPLPGRIGPTAPQVDGQIALDPHRDRGADFAAFDEVPLKGVTDLAEAGSARAAMRTSGRSFNDPPVVESPR